MIQIIPAILTDNQEDYYSKLKSLEPIVEWVQVDIVDGKFAPNLTIDHKVVGFYETSLKIEAHLMVNSPESYVENFLSIGVQRIIFPVESAKDARGLIKLIKERGAEAGLSLNPETGVDKVEPFVEELDTVLFLSVHPGFQDQKFIPETLEKIISLKKTYPDSIIEIDGGIDPNTAKKAIEAGADILVSGSFIFEYGNIEKAISQLREGVPK